jgi:hypothetical protein
MKSILFGACLLLAGVVIRAQDSTGTRALSLEEYNKAKTFAVSDLDKDTYVKFDNAYILDRGGFGKPYLITGDDGMKKRIDLYKLILKDGRVDLGTVIYYTTEKGKRYTACMPGYKADGKVWGKYFEDIHAIDKEEPYFVLKLSYVLSKELGFQLYRAAAASQGKDLSKEREAGTYGNDICFPGDMRVAMADGSTRNLSEVRAGDVIVTVDPVTRAAKPVAVKELTVHEAKNYAITKVLLLAAACGASDREISLHTQWLEATPNHPMVTVGGDKKAGELADGDNLVCLDQKTGRYAEFTVWDRTEFVGGMQRVYNIVAGGGSTFIMNNVMVRQKAMKGPE